MRQILVNVPRGQGSTIVDIAAELQAMNVLSFEGQRGDEQVDAVLAHVENRRVGSYVERVEQHADAHISFFPAGVLALKPPASEAADQVTDVEPLSPIEVFLAGHQSVGSWRGLIGFAAAAGAVAWVGLYVGTTYLLVSAMLVAPFAGPAMNTALATASGEVGLLRRSLMRYFVGLGVTVAAACILTLLVGPDAPSSRMIVESQISGVAALLPLVAGAAGALYLQMSERTSLVSGAAVGLLVAAALAPPATLLGMATALGRWDMVGSAAYLLALQLVGIHLAGALVFRMFGLSHRRARAETGSSYLFSAGLAAAALLMAGLLTIQFSDPVDMNRLTLAQDLAITIESEVSGSGFEPEQVRTQFLQSESDRPPILLAEILLRRPEGARPTLDAAADSIAAGVHRRLGADRPEVVPLVDVRWLSAPATAP